MTILTQNSVQFGKSVTKLIYRKVIRNMAVLRKNSENCIVSVQKIRKSYNSLIRIFTHIFRILTPSVWFMLIKGRLWHKITLDVVSHSYLIISGFNKPWTILGVNISTHALNVRLMRRINRFERISYCFISKIFLVMNHMRNCWIQAATTTWNTHIEAWLWYSITKSLIVIRQEEVHMLIAIV